jgi:hypothetical protein
MWRQSSTDRAHPERLGDDGPTWVSSAAVLPDGRGDAALRLHVGECGRRAAAGLADVASPPLLDALLGLPLGVDLPWSALTPRAVRLLTAAPDGVVAADDAGVRRLLAPPLTVATVVVPARGTWSAALRLAASFGRVAPSVVRLRREPRPEELLEADVFGVGVWVEGRSPREVLRPVAPPPRLNASVWAFQERAYGAWLTACGASARSAAGRRATRTA